MIPLTSRKRIEVVELRTVTWDCVVCQVNFGQTEPFNNKTDTAKTTCPDCGTRYIIHWGYDEWETWVKKEEPEVVKIDKNFKRRIRIVGKPGEVRGLGVEVQDADTGEVIDDIFRAIVRLDASSINTVVLSYYDSPVRKSETSDRPVVNTITATNPEMDVTACEVDTIENDARNE